MKAVETNIESRHAASFDAQVKPFLSSGSAAGVSVPFG